MYEWDRPSVIEERRIQNLPNIYASKTKKLPNVQNFPKRRSPDALASFLLRILIMQNTEYGVYRGNRGYYYNSNRVGRQRKSEAEQEDCPKHESCDTSE